MYVSKRGTDRLFRNDGGGAFTDVTMSPLDDAGNGQAVSWADYENDGDLDLYLVTQPANRLFRNDGGCSFTDVTSGLLRGPGGGRGLGWADYDDDGDLDLYVANYNEANMLLENQGAGVFTDAITAVLRITGKSRGVARGDYDLDGDLDLYLANNGRNKLFHNDLSSGNHWLEISLVGAVSISYGEGARVRVVADSVSQIREIAGASGYLSQGPLTAFFGMGPANTADTLQVTWQVTGLVQTFTDVTCIQRLEIVEDDLSGFVDRSELSSSFNLYPARPNPLSTMTSVGYDLPQAAEVNLAIYDVSGRCV